MLNKCEFIGNLGKDPEVRYISSGDCVANFSLACTERRGKDKKNHTEWIKVVAWGKLAEICEKWLKKGNQVYIEGKMQTRKWEDKNGNQRYTTEIKASEMLMLGGKSESSSQAEEQIPF